MADLNGRCMCGKVTWHSRAPTLRNLVCHCTDCQRATSAPFTGFLGFKPDDIHWSGKVTHYESSPATFRGFCRTCGTRLYFKSDQWPGEIHIHAATMDDPNAYQPSEQVVLRSEATWLKRLKDIPAYQDFDAPPEVVDL